MNVAVTGASGFIGSRVVPALAARGHAVRGLTRDAWDLQNGGDPAILSRVDTVVHAAAHVPRSFTDSGEASRCLVVNALGTLLLLEAAIAAGVQHFVYLSSGNAYQPGIQHAAEHDALYPSQRATYYLASKLCGELYVDHSRQAGRARTCILRPSSVYGPGMRAGGLVQVLASRLRDREKAAVRDGGRYSVDLVYVDDVVAGVAAAVEASATGIFNIGSGRGTTSLELASTLADLLQRDPSLIEVTGEREGPAVCGFASLDIERARRELGYEPRPLRAGLASYLESLA